MGDIVPTKDTWLLSARRPAAQHIFIIREHNSPMSFDDIDLQISHLYPQEADPGYATILQAQGNGVASEVVHAVRQYALEYTGVTAIDAYALVDDKGSIRISEKTGFAHTQALEKVYETDGIVYDDWVFRLERDALKL